MYYFFHIITILLLFLVIYHHLIYPLLMQIICVYKQNTAMIEPLLEEDELPAMTVVLPAYNEEHYIADKLRNLAILMYPKDKLFIILVSDGSTDSTIEIAQSTLKEPECCDLTVDIQHVEKNRGKVAVINEALERVTTPLVVMTDISAILSIDALLIAATRLKNHKVGLVTGSYQLLNAGSVGEKAYWNYQERIKQSESLVGSVMGAHGAFYAFKTAYFQPLTSDTINDDFMLPMHIVAQGYQAIYEPLISTIEMEKVTSEQDMKRRKRISAGNMQQFLRLSYLMLPQYKGVAFTFFSGKGLRVLMPFMLIFILLSSCYLAFTSLFWLAVLILQCVFYLLALIMHLFPNSDYRIGQIIYYLVVGHMANLIGAYRYLMGKEKNHWKRIG